MLAHEEAPGRDHQTGGTQQDANNSSLADYTESLSVARDLIAAGIPVFVAKPATFADGRWNPDGGHNGCGYWLPKGWQRTEPDVRVLDDYKPGDALGMVCGHKVDGVDTDPCKGGDKSRAALEADGAMPRIYGKADTPSCGTHELVATMGIRSRDRVHPGLDVKAGDPAGEGRGFLFIAPTRKRSKVDGTIGEYRWRERPDLAALAVEGPEDRSGEALAELVEALRTPRAARARNTRVPPQAASNAEVAAFVAEYTGAARPEILQGWIKALNNHFAKGSRHDATVSVLTGALKEARAGYFSAKAALDTLRPIFLKAATRPPTGQERQRSEGQALDEWNDTIAWAVREARVADLETVSRGVV